MAFSLRRASSISSANSQDSLEDFLSEFEVVSKEEQRAPPLDVRPRGFLAPRPPRPTVRLSSQPYQGKGRKPRQQQEASSSSSTGGSGRDASLAGYQQQTLLPVPALEAPPLPREDAGHQTAAFQAPSAASGRADHEQARTGGVARQQHVVPVSPTRPLDAYAEQLLADLGESLSEPLSPILSQQIPEWVAAAATAAQAHRGAAPIRHGAGVQYAPSASSTSHLAAHESCASPAQRAAVELQTATTQRAHASSSTPASSAGSSSGHFFAGPQSPPPLHAALQQQRTSLMQPHAFSLQQEDTALYRNPLVSQPAAAAARESSDMGGRLRLQQHLQADNPLLRDVSEPAVSMLQSQRGLPTQQPRSGVAVQPVGQLSHQRLLAQPARPQPGQVAPRTGTVTAAPGLAPPPSAPAAAQEGLRVPQQVLRKRDFESELLDRLLNSAAVQPPAPPALPVSGASVTSPAKPSFNALHLPMSRVLLITVVFALMGVPLLLFMAGRLQAQQHLRSTTMPYTTELTPVNLSVLEEPAVPPYGALRPDEDNATRHQHHLVDGDGRPGDALAAVAAAEGPQAEPETDLALEERSAREHRRGSQSGLRLLSVRVALSVR